MNPTTVLRRMTLEQKVLLLAGKDFWETFDVPELEIPSLFLADGPHGVRRQAAGGEALGLNKGIPATCFPPAATVANSWNPELGERVGQLLGTEALAQGVGVLLGPGLNMKRSPRCGRNFEYFSEDPHLAGKMAAAYVRGIQSQGVAACVKHFAARNQETGAFSVDVVVDERTLREIYLTGFEIAVTEGRPWALMSSSNRINGTFVNESSDLLRGVLRDEWGWNGVVVTDWGGTSNRVASLCAGSDLEMPGNRGQTAQELIDAVRSGQIQESLVDEAATRILDLVHRVSSVHSRMGIFDVERHHRMTQKVAEESIVLLKNEDGILPLPFDQKVAVIGDFARSARYQGAGSSIVTPTVLDHTLECFEESGIQSIGFEPGFERYGAHRPALVDRARELAARADVVLVYLGLDEVSEAQGVDRESLALPGNQVELLEAIAGVNANIVVVLSCGSVIEMPWLPRVKALVHGYLGGQAGARALLRVISGDVNPSGKLAETYPLRDEDTPCYGSFPGREATVEYREGPYLGYRYYDTAGVPVLFPFGFGLSYTEFGYSDLEVGPQGVSFTLTNVGNRPGMEVAQLYVGLPQGGIYRPKKELKGFCKVFLNPGQRRRVTIGFDQRTFRFWDQRRRSWEVEPGQYRLTVGASSADDRLSASWTVEGTCAPGGDDGALLPHYRSGRIQEVDDREFESLLGHPIPQTLWDRRRPLGLDDPIGRCRFAPGVGGRVVYHVLRLVHRILWKTGHRSQANLLMMSVFHLPFRGIARMTGGAVSLSTVKALLLVVNGRGVRGVWALLRSVTRGATGGWTLPTNR